MSYIFISCSKKNRDYARRLADRLLELGFDVWIDDRIDYGEDWELAIFDAIDGCAAFVVVMTPESYDSKWVRRECHHAEKRNKPPFPLLLEGEEFPRYAIDQYVNVQGGGLPPDDFYSRLARLVTRKSTRGAEVVEKPGIELPDPPAMISILPPPFEWCLIPMGKVTLEDASAQGGTKGGEFDLPSFYLAKYPITNVQFQAFVDADDGYTQTQWWEYSTDARAWHDKNPYPKTPAFGGIAYHPRVNVTWYEAVAFCRWLNDQAKPAAPLQIMLPTEQQWQSAAQGSDHRLYPWGDADDTTRCNTLESGIKKTTPVTQYPRGASPFGVEDMSGNVREWCSTRWGIDRHDLAGDITRCFRGGSWYYGINLARVTQRSNGNPSGRDYSWGFRICLAFPPG